jgi:hypothetical protein
MEDKINDLLKSVNDIKATQSKIISMVKQQSEKLTGLTTKVEDLVLRMDSLAADNESLKSRVACVEDKMTSLQQSSADPNSVIGNNLINEMVDRQSRANNIILFNLPEVHSDTINPISDESILNELLKLLLLDIHYTHISRVGIKDASKPRPLKITFSNRNDAFQVFSNQKKLKSNPTWSHLHFASDRTKMQRDFMSKLRQELLHRRSNGEDDLIIKYFKGIPTITKSKN